MNHDDSHAVLIPWKPIPTLIPPRKQIYLEELAHKTKGAFHYVAGMHCDRQEVIELLQSWGLPWTVVVAGGLIFHEEKELHAIPAEDRLQLLTHIRHARHYIECIEDEDLSPLLSLPYEDLGALLIVTAMYYVALRELAQRKSKRPLNQHILSLIESVGTTLIHITKQANLWLFKRDVEDLILQLCDSEKYTQSKAEYQHILERDKEKLREFCQATSRYFQQMAQLPAIVTYAPCGVEGFARRRKAKLKKAGSQEIHLTGFDFVIFDVIVPLVKDCYSAFGTLSSLGHLQGQITEQIAHPKPNGSSYFSFSLVLSQKENSLDLPWLDQNNYVCQLQISTPIMHAITCYGCLYPSCYSLYTEGSCLECKDPSLKELLNSSEGKIYTSIIASLKRGQAQKDAPITVYDKKLRPYALPKKATVLDFVYAYDEDLSGHVVCFINDREVPLERQLSPGDIVDFKTSDEPQEHEYWVNRKYVTTSRAVRAIQKQRVNEHQGYKLLYQKLEYYRYKLTEEELSQELHDFVKQYHLGTVNAYLERLDENADLRYTPDWAAQQIMHQIRERNEREMKPKWGVRLDVQSAENGPQFHYLPRMFCNVCQPTYPHDSNIVGYASRRMKRLVIHSTHCPRLIDRDHKQRAPLYPLIWQQLPMFRVGFSVTAQDRRDLVHDISKQLRYYQSTLVSIHADAVFKDAKLSLVIETNDKNEVLELLQKIKKVGSVIDVDIDPLKTAPEVYEQLQQKPEQTLLGEERIEAKQAWEEAQVVRASRRPRLRNPFSIARPPIEKMFFGRTNEIKKLQRELCADEGGKAILLYGPRRSGKSSLCHHFLEHYTYPPYWCVHHSLQDMARQNEAEVLRQIAEEVCRSFRERFNQAPPDWQNFPGDDPRMCLKRILRDCFASVAGARLILVLDEFGGTIEAYQKKILDERFFIYWRNLMSDLPQLSLVFVLPTIPRSFLTSGQMASAFNFMEHLQMEFLDEESAQQLLINPLREQNIVIHPGTVRHILDLTGCNPYYLTLIGSQLIYQLNQDPDKSLLNEDDLNDVIDRLVKNYTRQYFYFYHDELHVEEKPIVEAIVDIVQQSGRRAVSLKKIAARVQKPIEDLHTHLKRLQEGLIIREQRVQWSSKQPHYAFTIELVRLWMAQNGDFFRSADGN
jgi:(p)ppGpp synthase/HD superfamily hydrolase